MKWNFSEEGPTCAIAYETFQDGKSKVFDENGTVTKHYELNQQVILTQCLLFRSLDNTSNFFAWYGSHCSSQGFSIGVSVDA